MVLGNKEAVASIDSADGLTGVEAAEATSLEHVGNIFNGQEIHWRSVKKR